MFITTKQMFLWGEIIVSCRPLSKKMKSTERLNKFKEKFHPDASFFVGDGDMKAEDFLQINPMDLM